MNITSLLYIDKSSITYRPPSYQSIQRVSTLPRTLFKRHCHCQRLQCDKFMRGIYLKWSRATCTAVVFSFQPGGHVLEANKP